MLLVQGFVPSRLCRNPCVSGYYISGYAPGHNISRGILWDIREKYFGFVCFFLVLPLAIHREVLLRSIFSESCGRGLPASGGWLHITECEANVALAASHISEVFVDCPPPHISPIEPFWSGASYPRVSNRVNHTAESTRTVTHS